MIKRIFSFGFITWLAILLLGAGMIWQLFLSDKIESEKIKTLESTEQQQQQALQQITSVLKTYDEQFKQVADHSNQMVEGIKELDKIVRGDSRAWRLMQIQNFIEMAMVQGSLLNDTTAAINLLAAADNSLKQIDNPNLIPVRKALQEDITMLANHSVANISTIVLQLNTIASQVPTLPHKIRLQKEKPGETPEPTTPSEKWEQRAFSAWQELKSLIRIQRHNEPITPYFSQDDIWIINENLQLMLQQAAFAATRHYADLYQQELQHTQTWLSLYYDQNDPAVQAVLHALSELAKLSVASDSNLNFKTVDAWSKFVASTQSGGQ